MTAAQAIPFLQTSGLVASWTEAAIRAHLVWRAQNGELLTRQASDGSLVALVTWHRADTADDLRNPWRPGNSTGKHCYWSLLAARSGEDLRLVWERFKRRVPEWATLTHYGHRRNGVVGVSGATVERMVQRMDRLARRTRQNQEQRDGQA